MFYLTAQISVVMYTLISLIQDLNILPDSTLKVLY